MIMMVKQTQAAVRCLMLQKQYGYVDTLMTTVASGKLTTQIWLTLSD